VTPLDPQAPFWNFTALAGLTTVLLPFQAPPILLALELGAVRLGDATRLSLVSAALTLLILVPVDYLWWHWLGRL
jgi:di/tricarboxylate transporter